MEERVSEALANGDEVELAGVIRQAGTLGPALVALLADALDGGTSDEPVDRRYFPYRLGFSRWDKGRAKSMGWVNWRRDGQIVIFAKDCLNNEVSPKNMVKDAADKFGVSESTVRAVLKKHKVIPSAT